MNILKNEKVLKYKYGIIIGYIVLLCVFWDQFFKIITDGYEIPIINNFFWFSSTHNTGAAYGIFSGQTAMLISVSIVMLLLLILYNYFNKNKSIYYSISLGLIIGGAVGNLIDRIFLGYVRDFIKFSFFNFNFNIADACLTVGVVLFVIYLIFFDNLFKSNKKISKIK